MKKVLWFLICCGLVTSLLSNQATYAVDIEDLENGVVQIKAFIHEGQSERLQSSNEGAGIVVGTKANRVFIVTASHVVKGANKLAVRFRFWPDPLTGEPYHRKSDDLDVGVVIVN